MYIQISHPTKEVQAQHACDWARRVIATLWRLPPTLAPHDVGLMIRNPLVAVLLYNGLVDDPGIKSKYIFKDILLSSGKTKHGVELTQHEMSRKLRGVCGTECINTIPYSGRAMR